MIAKIRVLLRNYPVLDSGLDCKLRNGEVAT